MFLNTDVQGSLRDEWQRLQHGGCWERWPWWRPRCSEPQTGRGEGARAQVPLRGHRATAGGGTGPFVLVPLLRQPRVREGLQPPAGLRERQRSVASQWPWWPAGTRGNQATFPNGGRVTPAGFLGFLTEQAGIIDAVVGPGVKMRFQHLGHGE